MKVTYLSGEFICICAYEEKHIPKDGGFSWCVDKKEWYTNKLAIAKNLEEYWDNDAMLGAKYQQSIIDLSYAKTSNLSIPIPKNLKYSSYQKAAVEYAENIVDCLIADEMGAGKTIEAIALINYLDIKSKILIICPASLKINWQREIEKWLVRKEIKIAIAGKNIKNCQEIDILILSYQNIDKFKDIIDSIDFDLMICDEAHYLKNQKSKRTKNILGHRSVKKKIDIKRISAKRRLFLTGTPILNKPIELWSLLNACGIFKNYRQFALRYCDAKETRFGFDCSGASNLDELASILRQKFMIRRLKKDILSELPPKTRQTIVLEPPDNLKKILAEEAKAIEDYKQKMFDIAKMHRLNNDSVQYNKSIARAESAFLLEYTKMRSKTAIGKIVPVFEYALDAIEQNGNIVIFAHHKELIAGLADKFRNAGIKVGVLTGDTNINQRQHVVDDFQSGKINVFIGSIQAAGVGITLTACSTVIFAELDWTPANIAQAEDRCHRIGQKDNVHSIFMVFDKTIDMLIADKLSLKENIIKRVLL